MLFLTAAPTLTATRRLRTLAVFSNLEQEKINKFDVLHIGKQLLKLRSTKLLLFVKILQQRYTVNPKTEIGIR